MLLLPLLQWNHMPCEPGAEALQVALTCGQCFSALLCVLPAVSFAFLIGLPLLWSLFGAHCLTQNELFRFS